MKRVKNYLSVKTKFPQCLYKCNFVYADFNDPISYQIFKQHGIRSIRAEPIDHLDPKYCVIVCQLNLSERGKFLKALSDVQHELDSREYEQYCDTVLKAMRKVMNIRMGPYCY